MRTRAHTRAHTRAATRARAGAKGWGDAARSRFGGTRAARASRRRPRRSKPRAKQKPHSRAAASATASEAAAEAAAEDAVKPRKETNAARRRTLRSPRYSPGSVVGGVGVVGVVVLARSNGEGRGRVYSRRGDPRSSARSPARYPARSFVCRCDSSARGRGRGSSSLRRPAGRSGIRPGPRPRAGGCAFAESLVAVGAHARARVVSRHARGSASMHLTRTPPSVPVAVTASMHRAAARTPREPANATPLCGTTRTDSRSDGCAAIAADRRTREYRSTSTRSGRARRPRRGPGPARRLGRRHRAIRRGGRESRRGAHPGRPPWGTRRRVSSAGVRPRGLRARAWRHCWWRDWRRETCLRRCGSSPARWRRRRKMTRRRRSHPPRNRLVVATPPSSAPSPSGSSPTVSSARAAAEARANLTYATPLSPSTRTDRTSPNDEKRSRSSDSATPRPHTTNSRECGGRVVSDIVTRRGRTDRAVARYATASAAVRTPSMNARGSNPGDETRCVTSPYFGSGFFLRRLRPSGISVRRRVSPRMLHRGHVLPSYT